MKSNKRYSHGKRQWIIVFTWIFVALICLVFLPNAGKPFKIGAINDPKAESTIAKRIMETELPYGGSRIIVLYKSDKLNVHNPQFVSEVNKSLAGLEDLPFDNLVVSPYHNSRQISSDNHEAYAVIETNSTAEQLANYTDKIKHALGNPKKINMMLGGEPFYITDVYKLSESNLMRGELIALPISFIAMIIVFGGIIPALVTILSGIISIITIVTILYLLGYQMDLAVFVLNIATMLGLGLSLDYTLLITYRFREEYAKYRDRKKAITITLATAGKSILFSGLIVLISIGSLILFPINVLFSIGVGGIVVVIITTLCSLTFLPAMLYLLQGNVSATTAQLRHLEHYIRSHRWYKFAILVMKHPVLFMIPTILILVFLGYPFVNVKLSNSDSKVLPAWMESRQLMDQFEEKFNTNELSPMTIVFKSKNNSILTKENISALYDYANNIKKDSRVNRVIGIVSMKSELTKQQYQKMYSSSTLPFDKYEKQFFDVTTNGKYTVMNIISNYSKNDNHSFELLKTVRENHIGNGITKVVAGSSAEIKDTINILYSLFLKIVIVISIVTYAVLVWLLRSIVLPLKAILMNFLSLSVCYGMLVFIFQEGHFATLLHFETQGFTDMSLPILLFFSLFGLSMDYEVFLLTRIKEYYEKTGDNTKSVAMGLERSARIISSAAIIMIIVMGAFVTADIIFVKAFGLGTALAIAVDASLIRLLLVPATMRLLGDWNWYMPKWLDRLLPNINFEK